MPQQITVVTPSLNQARFIEANIKSVADQLYPSHEHIIVDGGSTDGTIDALAKFPHLRWISEKDGGQSHALNKGFRMATGEIIGWLNADDTYCPGAFDRVLREFENVHVMVVCGDGFEIDGDGKIVRALSSLSASPEELIRYWRWRYEFVQPALFFRRHVLEEVGDLDESLYYAMDYDFLIRLGRRYGIHHIAEPLANLRLYPESKTGKSLRHIIPDHVWEMHRVSHRYWGKPFTFSYIECLASFLGAVVLSALKNILFVRDAKSRLVVRRWKDAMVGGVSVSSGSRSRRMQENEH